MIYNKKQNKELVRGLTFIEYMEKPANVSIYTSYDPLAKKYLVFKGHFDNFQSEALNKNKSSAGTVTKGGLKGSVAHQMGIYLGFTKDYAIEKGNANLEVLVSFSESDIYDMKEGDILPFVKRMNDKVFTPALLAEVDFIPYKITALKLSKILADAVLYNSMIGSVKEDGNSSSTANDTMDEMINLIHVDFLSMDNTVKAFEDTNPEFVDGYHKNKVMVEVGTRHMGFKGIVRKNGVLQTEALVSIINTDKTAVSDSDAAFKMYCRAGTFMVQVKNANGDSQTKQVVVKYRMMTDVDFDLS